MDAHRQRESKWMSLMGSIVPSQWRKNKKVKKLIHEGVPSSVRYLIWSHLTDGKAKVVPGVYFQLGNRDRIAAATMIDEDIKSCFQEQPHLQGKKGPVLALLQAYLTMVPDVQYTTGLTLIAGELLLHAPEEDAFWIFTSVMDTHLRPYFSSNSTQMEVDATLFSRVVENNDSQLAKKLYVDMGIEPSAVCAPWFSALFVSALPPEYVNRVWDLFLYEGIPLLFRVGFAVLTCCRRQILGATSSDVVLDYLQHPSPGWLPSTPEGFLSLAHSVKMKDDDMRKTRLKMEAQVKRQAQAQTPRHLPITTSISLPRS
ncbi:RabGAP/TBC [Macrolepiota fuliginosa MF-IS2]|uniref:RabGAP/TBC n=1 Tax=Macrolepiota fuliginosa MF-IS2 TaxID=1400762 RepID=A0A9P5XBT0_9AGAR|nr:RabGAP/TBC [Macrolepiota fuliginosa MF-IS2]